MTRASRALFLVLVMVAAVGGLMPITALGEEIPLSKGQTVYVPVYSHIYSGNREQPLLLTVTLSIRNVDLHHSLTITRVDYHETQGKFLRSYLEKPVILKPMESTRYVVPERDAAGGSGANFIVTWQAQEKINIPIIESVMIGTQSQLGVSFTSRGQAIDVLP